MGRSIDGVEDVMLVWIKCRWYGGNRDGMDEV